MLRCEKLLNPLSNSIIAKSYFLLTNACIKVVLPSSSDRLIYLSVWLIIYSATSHDLHITTSIKELKSKFERFGTNLEIPIRSFFKIFRIHVFLKEKQWFISFLNLFYNIKLKTW